MSLRLLLLLLHALLAICSCLTMQICVMNVLIGRLVFKSENRINELNTAIRLA
jgi:hypothetical protein